MAVKQKVAPLVQPKFDPRISSVHTPLAGGPVRLKRGYMYWDKPITGYNGIAFVHYLFNPSEVSVDYSLADTSATASLIFANASDTADLRIPLDQTASWSILYDRTYELWGSYNDDGTPKFSGSVNDPRVFGVEADIMQWREFTGMNVGFNFDKKASANAGSANPNSGLSKWGNLAGSTGVLQMVPSWAVFGYQNYPRYYGYISDWNVTYTHWTQFMVPMRAVVNITFNLLPPPGRQPSSSPDNNYWSGPPNDHHIPNPYAAPMISRSSGRSGR